MKYAQSFVVLFRVVCHLLEFYVIYLPIFAKVVHRYWMYYPSANEGIPKYINGLVQDCSNSIANTLELLQSCTKPLIWAKFVHTKTQQTKLCASFSKSILSN